MSGFFPTQDLCICYSLYSKHFFFFLTETPKSCSLASFLFSFQISSVRLSLTTPYLKSPPYHFLSTFALFFFIKSSDHITNCVFPCLFSISHALGCNFHEGKGTMFYLHCQKELHSFLLSQFLWVRSPGMNLLCLLLRVSQAAFLPGSARRMNPLPNSFRVLTEFISLGYMTESPRFLAGC